MFWLWARIHRTSAEIQFARVRGNAAIVGLQNCILSVQSNNESELTVFSIEKKLLFGFWTLSRICPTFCENFFEHVAMKTCWVIKTAQFCPQKVFRGKMHFVKTIFLRYFVVALSEHSSDFWWNKFWKGSKVVFYVWRKKIAEVFLPVKKKTISRLVLTRGESFCALVAKKWQGC